MDENLIDHLKKQREEYIRKCELDENKIISEMQSGRAYLTHCTRIYLEKNNLSTNLGEVTLKLFNRFEKKLVK